MAKRKKRVKVDEKQTDKEVNVTALSVEGYKSFGKPVKVSLKALTVLAGINSSGKSSFFQPLLLLKQTHEAAFNPDGLLLNGPNLKIYEADKVCTEISRGARRDNFELGFYFDDGGYIKNVYQKKEQGGLSLSRTKISIGETKVSLSANSRSATIKKLFKDEGFWEFITNMGKIKLNTHVDENRGFFEVGLRSTKSDAGFSVGGGDHSKHLNQARSLVNFLHIPGIRGNPERSYKYSASRGRYVGRFEDYTASIIYQWQIQEDESGKRKLKKLIEMLQRLGLTTSVQAKKVGDAFISLQVGALPVAKKANLSEIDIADVGFGVSQVLPILVALLEAKQGQIVYIEQPELHLHPRAQSVMAEIFAEFSKEDIFVVMETHSAIILRKVQTLVAKKELAADDVSLNWFSMGSDGMSVVTSASLDKKGRYGDWPQDFDDVYMQTEKEFITSGF